MRQGTKSGAGRLALVPGRVWLVLVCLAYACIAVGSGLDRAKGGIADPATEVPAPFASKALEARAWYAMNAGDWPKVVHIGTMLVARDPIEPVATAILGAGRDGVGDAAGAEAAYRLAGKMGWREDLTQRYWLGRALARGDYPTAAAHLDALLRLRPELLLDRDLLGPMEKSDQGQQALAGRLVARPYWLGPYMRDVWSLPREMLMVRTAVLARSARLGLVAGCDLAAATSARLVDVGEAQAAFHLWRDHCPQTGGGLVTDGNFAAATFAPTIAPFDWDFPSNSDVDTAFVAVPGGGKSLTINTAAAFTKFVASQFIVAPAGRYRLSWASQGHTGADTPIMQASFDCAKYGGDWLPATRDTRSGRWVADVVLGDHCAGKWLNFAVRPGIAAGAGVNGGEVTLGAVRLEPLVTP